MSNIDVQNLVDRFGEIKENNKDDVMSLIKQIVDNDDEDEEDEGSDSENEIVQILKERNSK